MHVNYQDQLKDSEKINRISESMLRFEIRPPWAAGCSAVSVKPRQSQGITPSSCNLAYFLLSVKLLNIVYWTVL